MNGKCRVCLLMCSSMRVRSRRGYHKYLKNLVVKLAKVRLNEFNEYYIKLSFSSFCSLVFMIFVIGGHSRHYKTSKYHHNWPKNFRKKKPLVLSGFSNFLLNFHLAKIRVACWKLETCKTMCLMHFREKFVVIYFRLLENSLHEFSLFCQEFPYF